MQQAQLRRTEEAEVEARRAYATEQSRRWFRASPNGADAVAAATKAADAARERTAQYLLANRLGRLHEQPAPHTETETAAAGGGGTGCASSPPGLNGDTAGAVIALTTELSGVDLARQALVAAREQAKKHCGHHKRKPKRRTGQVVRGNGREPLGLGAAVIRMMAERGMVAPASGGGILAHWDDILTAAAPKLVCPRYGPWAASRSHGRTRRSPLGGLLPSARSPPAIR